MTRRSVAAIALATACALAVGAVGWHLGWFGRGLDGFAVAKPAGAEPDAWSATVVRSFETGDRTVSHTSHFARSGDRTRHEWEEGGRRMALVVRPDLGVSWLVDLSDNTYFESGSASTGEGTVPDESEPLSAQIVEASIAAGMPADGFATRRERIGEEVVDGHACVVYRSHLEALDGTVSESKVWEAADFAGLAIRSETRSPSGNVVRTELQQLKRDPEPGAFELPPGARRSGQTP